MYSVRKAELKDAKAIASVHVESWKSTYSKLIDKSDLQIDLDNRITLWETVLKSNQKGQAVFVMENDQDIVGFISGGKERSRQFKQYDGEIYAIYLLEAFQGLGLGKLLLKTFAKEMERIRYEAILVWVLTKNPSSNFYKKMGAKPVLAENVKIGEGTYEETAYGWLDLKKLIGSLQ